MSTLPQSASSSSTPFMLHWNFTSGIMTFSLCHNGVFFGQFPLLNNYFCELSGRFTTGKQGGNTTPRFAVCVRMDGQMCDARSPCARSDV